MVFLSRLQDISDEDRTEFLNKLDASDKFKEGIFEKVLLLIERLDETRKAEFVGNLFRMLVTGVIPSNVFLRLAGMVDKAFIDDLLVLHYQYNNWRDYDEISAQYPLTHAAQFGLLSIGALDQRVTSSTTPRISSTITGKTPPPEMGMRYGPSSIGLELANLIYHDLKNEKFIKTIEQIRKRYSQ